MTPKHLSRRGMLIALGGLVLLVGACELITTTIRLPALRKKNEIALTLKWGARSSRSAQTMPRHVMLASMAAA
jgi:hypothetical protein